MSKKKKVDELRRDLAAKLRQYAGAARELAVDRGVASDRELAYLVTLEALATAYHTFVRYEKPTSWLEARYRHLRLDFYSGFVPDEERTPAVDRVVDIFSDGYSAWTERHFGTATPYVMTRYDREALVREIMPYLRERSEGHGGRAFPLWRRIVEHFFASELANSDERRLRDVPLHIQTLEHTPIGRRAVERDPSADEQRVLDAFRERCQTGRATPDDASALITRAGSVEAAERAIAWMYTTEDEYLARNRPYSLDFITRIYDRFERARPRPATKDRMVAKMRVIQGGGDR